MSYLTGFTTEELNIMLKAAQNALHELMIGTKAIKLMRAGRSVEYTQASKSELITYISDLQAAIAGKTATRGTARVSFT